MAVVSSGRDLTVEEFVNTTARWYHGKRHKGGRAWFCESDRTFAEELFSMLNDLGWRIVNEDDRSS